MRVAQRERSDAPTIATDEGVSNARGDLKAKLPVTWSFNRGPMGLDGVLCRQVLQPRVQAVIRNPLDQFTVITTSGICRIGHLQLTVRIQWKKGGRLNVIMRPHTRTATHAHSDVPAMILTRSGTSA